MQLTQFAVAQLPGINASIIRLKKYQLPLSPGQALLYLGQLKESAALLVGHSS